MRRDPEVERVVIRTGQSEARTPASNCCRAKSWTGSGRRRTLDVPPSMRAFSHSTESQMPGSVQEDRS